MDTPLINKFFNSAKLSEDLASRLEKALGESGILNPSPEDSNKGVSEVALSPLLECRIEECRFVVVDLETTGAFAQTEKITEVGAVEVLYREGKWKTGRTFSSLVNPGKTIPIEIQQLTGITDEMVSCAPPEGDVLPDFFEFSQGAILVGQNVAFDRRFLNIVHSGMRGAQMPNPFLCTCRLSRRFFKIARYNLDMLATYFQLRFNSKAGESARHRALGDAQVTAEVFIRIMESIPERFAACETIRDLLMVQSRSFQPKIYGKFELLLEKVPNRPGWYAISDVRGLVIYVRRTRELKNAVRNIFHRRKKDPLIFRIMARCNNISWQEAPSFEEALHREEELIREHRPYFNYV